MISSLLNVSPQYISKGKVIFADEGAEDLRVAYRSSEGYLSEAQREAVVAWISKHQTLSLEAAQAYVETR